MKVFDLKALNRALYIIKKIEDLTGEPAYIVGGAVRDYLYNIYTNDFDIAISVFSTSIYHSRFFKENFKLISFQKYYKSLRAIDKRSGLKFEFTPMRKERYFNKFNPKIKFVDSPEEDFLRRDYTINSLYMNKYMEIIDPCNSFVDLNKLVLRLNENKIGKISEDPKRFLRGLKFVNRYNLKLETNTFRILNDTKNSINEVSSEYFSSIVDDFFKNLSMSGFRIIRNLNLFDFFSYEKCVNISEIRKIKCFDLRLFCFIFLYSYEKSIVFNKIINSKYVKKSTKVLFKDFCFYLSKVNSDFYDVITSILDKYGLDILKDFYELSRILNDSYILSIKIDKFSKIIHNIERGKLPSNRREINITGEDLISIGYKSGPQIGEIIKTLNIMVLKGEKNDKDNLLRLALNLKSQRR